ncbi:MAG: DUF1800 family protein [Pirellulales bacterium]
MLASNYFHSSAIVGRHIKSPVEFAVGLVRSLEGHVDHYALADDLAALGQQVFYPPNVKGWNGGREWINAYTLMSRANLVERLTVGTGRYERKLQIDESTVLNDVAGQTTDGRAAGRAFVRSAARGEAAEVGRGAIGEARPAPRGRRRMDTPRTHDLCDGDVARVSTSVIGRKRGARSAAREEI